MKTIITESERDTQKLGERLGKNLKAGDILALVGELGSGKTVLVKGIAQGLGIPSSLINSPSFVLIREYPSSLNLYHFDLYRLKDPREIESLGWEEYRDKRGVLVIEWADRMEKLLPDEYLYIGIEILDEKRRKINLIPKGEKYKKLISKVWKRR
ncbi:MAG: tRNA (adenosine(37)-N6)-threonylcarbamoyltransferase complex ATPase subunit type 1 TsaE [Candidatus Omnitrophica bacterium]|nr:tRNA (adenosine(37)-N6)-threonylcarbamoyltransferase complex ATPase subunit type 1 TsaE [Candidatus Omnitrophota bacterium]MCM8794067.1 tRNA (adenosine(37)-N6)-threonylcarbamoyltransferase complex ATPase subunit type 1 TsaE [Candidatus Omnitrophota bacterium]